METQTAIVLGLILNLFATVGGVVGLLLKFENRMTTMETHLIHLLPKRRTEKRSR